jgi:hypothetical protein
MAVTVETAVLASITAGFHGGFYAGDVRFGPDISQEIKQLKYLAQRLYVAKAELKRLRSIF